MCKIELIFSQSVVLKYDSLVCPYSNCDEKGKSGTQAQQH